MKNKQLYALIVSIIILTLYTPIGLADESDGDLYTFCPYISTNTYNSFMKSLLKLNDTQAALFQVSLDGLFDGSLIYSDVLKQTVFVFNTDNEYDTAKSAYIRCSMEDSSTLKNIPMLIWATIIQQEYYGEIEETGSSFLEWVNEDRKDGDIFTTPYFYASYTEETGDNCDLLLIKTSELTDSTTNSNTDNNVDSIAVSHYKSGTYSASAKGIGGDVTVTMTFDADSITDVQIDVSSETPSIGGAIGEDMAAKILDAQSSEVDGVSKATITSDAILIAARECVEKASAN